jgi:integral membrane protein
MVVMGNFFDLSTVAKRLRFIAVLEAISWVFLIVGMVFKRLPEPVTWPVRVFGMTHGIIFVLFVITAILAARELGWNVKTTVLALLSSIPPFFTVLFEMWAVRAGQLGELSNAASADSGAPASVTP